MVRQRTLNMVNMFVAREMFQLSGWLKAVAVCEGRGVHTVRGLRAGRREGRRRASA